MTQKAFTLVARVSTDNPWAIRAALKEFLPEGSIMRADDGFLVRATLRGGRARELIRTLLSALRRIERRTRLRAEWASGG